MAEHAHDHSALADRDMAIDRLWTIPNLLTLIRLCLVPVFLYLLFVKRYPGPAGWLLVGLSSTDWVDGYIARHFNQASTFGAMFDPIVDRVLIVFGLGGIVLWGGINPYVGWLVILREVLMSLFVLYITIRGVKRLEVTWQGKRGAFLVMQAFPAFLGSHEMTWSHGVRTALEVFGWLSIIPGMIFGWIALGQYVRTGLAGLKTIDQHTDGVN